MTDMPMRNPSLGWLSDDWPRRRQIKLSRRWRNTLLQVAVEVRQQRAEVFDGSRTNLASRLGPV